MKKPLFFQSILDLKLSYSAKVVEKPYLVGHAEPKLKKFYGRKGNTTEYVVCFLVLVPFSIMLTFV